MNKLYNIIDCQLKEYYKQGVTLEEAKEIAIRLVERSMLEGGQDNAKEYAKLLHEVEQDKTTEDVAESLMLFDYGLEEI